MKKQRRPAPTKLTRTLRPFFWDYDFARLSWKADRDLIIGRILAAFVDSAADPALKRLQ